MNFINRTISITNIIEINDDDIKNTTKKTIKKTIKKTLIYGDLFIRLFILYEHCTINIIKKKIV